MIRPPLNQGRYAPDHLQAIWISDTNNTRIKTLTANPGRRPFHLRAWQMATEQGLDGFTGATIQDYSEELSQITWNLDDQQGNRVYEGTYRAWFELTESNTNEEFEDGDPGYAVYFVDFDIDDKPANQSDNNHPNFTQVNIIHSL